MTGTPRYKNMITYISQSNSTSLDGVELVLLKCPTPSLVRSSPTDPWLSLPFLLCTRHRLHTQAYLWGSPSLLCPLGSALDPMQCLAYSGCTRASEVHPTAAPKLTGYSFCVLSFLRPDFPAPFLYLLVTIKLALQERSDPRTTG